MRLEQETLFDVGGYPTHAAYRNTDTSKAAAETIDAAYLREQVVRQLALCPLTADECAEQMGVDKLSVRPRCSELKKLGRIADSGVRRPNDSGKKAIVWRLIPRT